ncbi:MAG: glycosyltransferase [Thermoanaerobaculia bacterium]|nr:glycosyltransferase [Thermoanaerobaculia bacterium]
MDPLVSVVVPTRDRAEWLVRCLESVRRQTEAGTEILVVDDGSRSPVSEEPFGDRVRLIRLPRPRGAAAARNAGLAAARARFVAFLDDDDVWAPRKLELQSRLLAGSPDTVVAVGCGFDQRSRDGELIRRSERPDRDYGEADFVRSAVFGTSIPLLRRAAVVAAGGFDEQLQGCQDRDLWLRLSVAGGRFRSVPEILATHVAHPGQISGDARAKLAGRSRLLRKHWRRVAADREVLADHLLVLALLCRATGDETRGRRLARAALRRAAGTATEESLRERWRSPAPFRQVGDVTLYY